MRVQNLKCHKRAIHNRTLHLEALEPRMVLSHGGLSDEIVEISTPFVSEPQYAEAQTVVIESQGETTAAWLTELPELTPERLAHINSHVHGETPEIIDFGGPTYVSTVPELQPDVLPGLNAGGASAAGDFQFYRNETVDGIPAGMASNINEPSVGSTGRGVLYTGNWYAALSSDNGENWQYIDPATRFAASWGGFCCDQRVAHDDIRDLTIWYMQYARTGNGPNDTGGVRIAVARSESDLLNNTFTTYDITPATFGFGTGEWFDFPHMQVTDDYLYITTNLYRTSGSTAADYFETIIYRLDLDDLDAGAAASIGFWRTTNLYGDNQTIGLVTGATGTMYGASYGGATSINVYDIVGAGGLNRRTVSGLNTTNTGTHNSFVPNGKNWTGRADSRMQTGWVGGGTVGFAWNSAQGTGRAQPFVRVVTFNTSNLSAVTGQPDIWNSSFAWHYPAFSSNARGHIAGSIAIGGPSDYPGVQILIDDDYTGGWEAHFAAQGTDSGNSRWGDYLGAQADDVFNNTWLATGFIQTNASDTNAQPYFFWFGRERDNPGANLRGTSFNVVQEPREAGNSFDVDFAIINDGANFAPSSRVDFYISTNNIISTLDRLIGSYTIGSLAAGAATGLLSTTLALPLPGDAYWVGDATYYIGMRVDAGSAVGEYDEGDNSNEGEFIDFDGVAITNTVPQVSVYYEGVLPEHTTTPTPETLSPVEIVWRQIILVDPITAAVGDYLTIDTYGSSLIDTGFGPNDTEIAIYDVSGNLITSNDDFAPPARESRIAFGLDPLGASFGDLAAGTYWVAAGGYNTTFGATGFNVTSTSTASGVLVVNFVQEQLPDVVFLGALPEGYTTPPNEMLIPHETYYYQFNLSSAIDAADGDYFVIDTYGSNLIDVGLGANDTEIGLYNAAGTLIATNDDFASPARESRLAFGLDPLGASSGDLAAGAYYLAVGAYNTSFGAGFSVSSTSDIYGTVVVNFDLHVDDKPGDFDMDGDVDGDDFLIWQSGFGITSGATLGDGDADGDGDVDGDDFLVWQANFGSAGGGGSGLVAAPKNELVVGWGFVETENASLKRSTTLAPIEPTAAPIGDSRSYLFANDYLLFRPQVEEPLQLISRDPEGQARQGRRTDPRDHVFEMLESTNLRWNAYFR